MERDKKGVKIVPEVEDPTVVSNYINTMKTTFDVNFDLNSAVKQHGYT